MKRGIFTAFFLLVLFWHGTAHANFELFFPYISYPTGSWPEATAIGDVNGDDRNDVVLVTSNNFPAEPDNDYKLFVFLQDNWGHLKQPVKYAAGSGIQLGSVAIGDINDDGRADVVVGSTGSADSECYIGVFLQDSSGLLQPMVKYQTHSGVSIRIADLNADGLLDVVGNGPASSKSIAVFYQNASGALNPPVTYNIGAGGYQVAVGDVNADGLQDILALSGTGTTVKVAVLHQNSEGSFDPPVYYGVGGTIQIIWGMTVGDVNGDGRNDVLVNFYSNPNAKIGIFLQGDGGLLMPKTTLPAYGNPEAITVGDVDNNGRDDIVTAAEGRLILYRQQRDGTLLPKELVEIPSTDHYNPQGIATGDINGDGYDDVVLADYPRGLIVLKQRRQKNLLKHLYTSPTGTGDCTETNPCSLQMALDEAEDEGKDDIIHLAEGVYTASGGPFTYNIFSSLSKERFALSIIGKGAGKTVLDGGGKNQILFIRTVPYTSLDDSGADIFVKGIAFQNGNSSSDGGGLYVYADYGDISVQDCEFRGNSSDWHGGGAYAYTPYGAISFLANKFINNSGGGAVAQGHAVSLRNNLFDSNSGGVEGAGVSIGSSNAVFSDNVVQNNHGSFFGGGLYSRGGITITDSTFINNSAVYGGGAHTGAKSTIMRSFFAQNFAGSEGGGLYAMGMSTITNNIFTENNADDYGYGGGVFIEGRSGTINFTNNTVAGNSALWNGGGLYLSLYDNTAIANIYNNIFWNNVARRGFGRDLFARDDDNLDDDGAKVNLFNNDISNYLFQRGNHVSSARNLSKDPLLKQNFRLQTSSPCVDAGNNNAPGVYRSYTDFFGNRRFFDGNSDGGEIVDIGAFEYVPVPGTSSLKLVTPEEGEIIPSGAAYNIYWSAPPDAVKFNILFSSDNGVHWDLIADGAKGSSYKWTVPIPLLNERACLLKIIALDTGGTVVGRARTASPFMVEVVAVTSPSSGETLVSGTNYYIKWKTNATAYPVSSVQLYYTTDGGTNWTLIKTINSGNTGSHKWTVPGVSVLSDRCRIKLLLLNSDGKVIGVDQSAGHFTIKPAP